MESVAETSPLPLANTVDPPHVTRKKPYIIGLYGIPGSGKSTMLNELRSHLDADFVFFEGSDAIASVVPGGLQAFHCMDESEKTKWREAAINLISEVCTEKGKTALITGHFMFWTDGEAQVTVWTAGDQMNYTHIVYLDTAPESVATNRRDDVSKLRPADTADHLRQWRDAEKTVLRQICRANGILFTPLDPDKLMMPKLVGFFHDLHVHDEEFNLEAAIRALDGAIKSCTTPETVLVLDADRTLTSQDTGTLFWDLAADSSSQPEMKRTLELLFGSPLAYSYQAFRQAMFLYEEILLSNVNSWSKRVAAQVILYPEMKSLLNRLHNEHHVAIIVMTCGLRRIWEAVFDLAGLAAKVKVIGGGLLADGYVVTPNLKAELVNHLKEVHSLYVCAIGDSPLDIQMLQAADQSIVVVGEKPTRSRTMDAALSDAIDNHGLQASQVLLPSTVPPRLDITRLPLMQLSDPDFIENLIAPRGLRLQHATGTPAAQLLMTDTRDATKAGPALREAHRKMGWFLAAQHLTSLIGLEAFPIPHVQGGSTQGHRLLHEQSTTIIALMRGGEPMAMGINDVFPAAMFVHARKPEDVLTDHVMGKSCVILVDSVINSGKSVVEFVRWIRQMQPRIRIFVVAGVVQDQSVAPGSMLQDLGRMGRLEIVALRVSENKFTGTGTTDTGNRLFNTTQMA